MPPSWTRCELERAAREGVPLEVIAPGLRACTILSVRPSPEDFVVVRCAFPGTAVVRFDAIRTPAPVRYAAGARVATPYGAAVVKEMRAPAEAGVSYVVEFVDKSATGGWGWDGGGRQARAAGGVLPLEGMEGGRLLTAAGAARGLRRAWIYQ